MSGKKRKATPLPPACRLITADELGLLKVVEVPHGPAWEAASVVQRWGQPDKNQAVQALAISAGPLPELELEQPVLLAASRADGTVHLHDAQTGGLQGSIPSLNTGWKRDEGCVVNNLCFLAKGPSKPRLLSSTKSGLIRIHQQPVNPAVGSETEDAMSPHSSQHWQEQCSFKTVQDLTCMATDVAEDQVAITGQGQHLQVWSLSSQQETFRAKGGKPNRVGLVDLPNTTAVAFLPDQEGNRVFVGTASHKLWLYDTKAGKRPQLEVSWGEARINSLAPEPSGERVWVANAAGVVEALDLRCNKMLGQLKGAKGSVRSLALHPGCDAFDESQNDLPPLVASVGLDRYLRVYDASSRQCKARVYMKQHLTAAVFTPVSKPQQRDEEDVAGEGDEEVDNFAGLGSAEDDTGNVSAHKGNASKGKKKGHKKQKSRPSSG